MKKDAAVPGFFEKRKLLENQERSPGELSRRGRELAELGLMDEAITFFSLAGDSEGLEGILEQSRREGDAFSFEAALRGLGREAAREEWSSLGERAFEGGRLWFAYRAFEKSDSQSGLEKVRQAMTEKGILPPA